MTSSFDDWLKKNYRIHESRTKNQQTHQHAGKTMKKRPVGMITDAIVAVLSEDERVVFAFLYGSTAENEKGNDIDIAVYATGEDDLHKLSADLKVALHKRIGLPPDVFDVRILNGLVEACDVFGLLYLKNVLNKNKLLVDRNPDARVEFLECYGKRFRECEGLMQEVLT